MKRSRPQKSPALVWKTLSKRAWKTDMGDGRSEVLVLKMSNKEFDKFHASKRAAKDYIDRHGFLKKEVNKVIFCVVLSNKKGKSVGWDVILTHTIQSWIVIAASQIPK